MPLFDERDEALVKAFLFNKIEKECDADPGIMADYILVTLQNDMTESELKQHCKTDLVEFFGDKTTPFVDTLFESLATKQYLPPSQQQSQQKDSAIVAGSSSARPSVEIRGTSARTARDDSSSHHHHPYQRDRDRERGAAGNGDSSSSARRRSSRSPTGIGSRLSHRERRRSSRSPSREERRPREPRSFDPSILNGPLEPNKSQQLTQQQQQQLMFQQQQQQQQQQLHRKRKPCFEFLRKGTCQRGEACTFAHVTGEQAQAMGMQVPQNLINPAAIASSGGGGPMQFGMMGGRPQMQPGFFAPLQQQQQQPGAGAFTSMRPQQQQLNGRPQVGGGHHQNQYHQQQQQQQQHSTTAVFVTNIPDESLNDEAVKAFFGKFGTINDTRIDYTKHSAVVDFTDNSAQLQALGTPEAVFNNRFVRVHKAWAHYAPGTASGAQDSSHPSGGDSSISGGNQSSNQQQQQQQQPPVWKPKSVAIKKAEMIEKYVEQQKELMKKLTTIKDMPAATRKIIMDSINQIQTKVDEIRRPHKPDSSSPAAAAGAPAPSANSTSSAGSSNVTEKQALQNKLQALQQEAERLGMNSGSGSGFASTAPRKPPGAYNPAAATAALRGSMSLDKRPRTLVLRNVAPETAERLDSGLAQFGQIENIARIEDDDNGASDQQPPFTYSVRYRARWEAENALKAVASLDGFASVTADWETQ
ncbi:hypothetical protein IWW48_004731 [Coemansia sp. RSA 1200]|nr:hypothetical protein IWW48_004731 [Coemansia sp. RSA 1200]